MHRLQQTASAFAGAALLALMVAAPARADDWNKRTIVTFTQPVEVPGMVLAQGTYVFRLLDSPSNRDVVQILNARENHVYVTTFTIPTLRYTPADHTVITFYEAPPGVPQAIKDWYYPGDTLGQEFVYSKKRRAEILAASYNVPAPPPPVAPPETPAPTVAETQPAEPPAPPPPPVVAENSTPTPAPAPEEQASAPPPPPAQPEPPAEPPAPNMPATASDLPLIAIAGLLSFAGAFGLRAARRVH